MAQSSTGPGFWAVVDPARELYVPALSGWGVDPSRALLLRPQTKEEMWWAIEECLRCPGVSATWACVDDRIPVRVQRRWQLSAELGRGVGLLFRPAAARREPVWAELRLLVTPMVGAQEDTRTLNIEVLYRRGGLGGIAQAWEIDMPRVLCVWFPRWPIQRLRCARPELSRSEIVLFAGQNQRPLISACSSNAERLGIRIGQTLAEAKALLPKAVFLPVDFAADRDALCQLALDCQRFTPLVGLEDDAHPESLFCEVTGCTHLWGGEARFLNTLGDYWLEPDSRSRSR